MRGRREHWVGPAALVILLLVPGARPVWRRLAAADAVPGTTAELPAHAALLTPVARVVAGSLRALSRASLLGLGLALLLDEALRSQSLTQIRLVSALVMLPEAAAACLLAAYRARVTIELGVLVFLRGRQRLVLPLRELAALRSWRLPLPGPSVTLQEVSGGLWRFSVAAREPGALTRAVAAAGGPPAPPLSAFEAAREAVRRGRLSHPLLKFGVLPLLLTVPAFHLHQHIAYGSAVGEWLSFGAQAYGMAFGVWWAAWVIGVLLFAAVLRLAVEGVALLGAALRPALAVPLRHGLERSALWLTYGGLPAWLLLRVSGLVQ